MCDRIESNGRERETNERKEIEGSRFFFKFNATARALVPMANALY
jgi:hypothetical protein